ncbi:hypothetical protein H312_01227 [Anncaliia algerae PRA339]|uniref:Uncharacterized protein n=1 Tax=Anncaliia algerae PRA339 TaxID=1288291 RepID=A0A059F2Z5_9MICR|nr:hypothetical protein H312_01227 [Anncaliia algerae PRA339]
MRNLHIFSLEQLKIFHDFNIAIIIKCNQQNLLFKIFDIHMKKGNKSLSLNDISTAIKDKSFSNEDTNTNKTSSRTTTSVDDQENFSEELTNSSKTNSTEEEVTNEEKNMLRSGRKDNTRIDLGNVLELEDNKEKNFVIGNLSISYKELVYYVGLVLTILPILLTTGYVFALNQKFDIIYLSSYFIFVVILSIIRLFLIYKKMYIQANIMSVLKLSACLLFFIFYLQVHKYSLMLERFAMFIFYCFYFFNFSGILLIGLIYTDINQFFPIIKKILLLPAFLFPFYIALQRILTLIIFMISYYLHIASYFMIKRNIKKIWIVYEGILFLTSLFFIDVLLYHKIKTNLETLQLNSAG